MSAVIASTRRIELEVGGDTVTFVCRIPTGPAMSKFLSSRFRTQRNKVESRVYEARAEFFDAIIVDLENAQFENAENQTVDLGAATVLTEADKTKWSGLMGVPVSGWKDLIPLGWKSSVAQWFEDSANAEESAKN